MYIAVIYPFRINVLYTSKINTHTSHITFIRWVRGEKGFPVPTSPIGTSQDIFITYDRGDLSNRTRIIYHNQI